MPGSSTFRTVLPPQRGTGPTRAPGYYFGKLTDPLEAGTWPLAGTPEPDPPVPGAPTGRVAQPREGDAWLPTAPSRPARASTATVRQPRNSQDPSTTQVTSPRPAMVPSGTVPGATPASQGRPLPHQVEVQPAQAPAATA